MKFESKFDCGQAVWIVSNKEHIQIVRCETCESTGKCSIKGVEYICPACEGRSSRRNYAGRKYFVREFDTRVGKVEITLQISGYGADGIQRNRYMVEATGVGSGSVYEEEDLFASLEEAKNFCDRMNGALPKDEEVGEPIPEIVYW